MPAHVPRRSFSTPFIVTIAAASAVASTACEHTYDNPPPPPRVPESNAAAPDAAASASPTTTQSASDTTSAAQWQITRDEKANSCATRKNIDCVTTKDALDRDVRQCKQAPPEPYACPAGVLTYPAWAYREKGATKCRAAWEPARVECPPTSTCNPPGTQLVDDVPCPK
jgi:hypothetical protein